MTTTLKLVSWNVNGLRAILKKGNLLDFITATDPDIICLQETKMKPGQADLGLPAYTEFWHSATRPGYSGTAILAKKSLLETTGITELAAPTFDIADTYGHLDTEGRILALDCGDFYLVNTYVPNSKPDLSRLDLRHDSWDPALRTYLKSLNSTKPVIVCGDFNAAHTEIDIARPKENAHSAGFTREERVGITNLIHSGFIDTFRTLHPDQIQYTWWAMRGGARSRNVGWRIDYFFISESLAPHLQSATIHDQIMGSDHAPISIELKV